MMKRVANKLHRTIHRQHDAEHPGTWKRTTWALVNKARLEATLDRVTNLVDRLNTDFPPLDPKPQLNQYCETVTKLKLTENELKEIGIAAGDYLFKTIVKLLDLELRIIGSRARK